MLPALSLPFFGSLEGMQHLFQRQPLIPTEVSVEAEAPQCDPFRIPGTADPALLPQPHSSIPALTP